MQARSVSAMLGLLVCAAGVIICVGLCAAVLNWNEQRQWVRFFLSYIPIFLGPMVIHELGHLFAAFVNDFWVVQFTVAPLSVVRVGKRFRLRLYLPVAAPPGFVAAAPRAGGRTKLRMALFIVGGAAANLIAGGAGLALVRWFEGAWPMPLPETGVGLVLTLFACFSFLTGLLALLPVRSRGWLWDGSWLVKVLRQPSRAECDLIMASLRIAMVAGTRPRDLDASLLARALNLCDGSLTDLLVRLYAYYHELDCGRTEKAREFLELAYNHPGPHPLGLSGATFYEKAYFEGFHRRNPAAGIWLIDVKNEVEAQTRLRAEAAVLLVEGKFAEAAAKAEAGLAAIPWSVDRGGSIAEMEWLDAILAESRRNLPAIGSPVPGDVPSAHRAVNPPSTSSTVPVT
jgi:hypothetical protein